MQLAITLLKFSDVYVLDILKYKIIYKICNQF